MAKKAGLIIFSVVILFIINTGCFDALISDWEYEYYYSVEIRSNSTNNYTVIVPLPDASASQIDENRYLENYVENLQIENGVCSFIVIEHNSDSYLQINGSSNVSISSSFIIWSRANVSIEKDPPMTMVYSDSSNISLIVDSRGVRQTNEVNTWDLFYSVSINPDEVFPIPTIETWDDHLPDEYFFIPQQGWHSYPIQEDINWGNALIRSVE